jgi:hypothetical protein
VSSSPSASKSISSKSIIKPFPTPHYYQTPHTKNIKSKWQTLYPLLLAPLRCRLQAEQDQQGHLSLEMGRICDISNSINSRGTVATLRSEVEDAEVEEEAGIKGEVGEG